MTAHTAERGSQGAVWTLDAAHTTVGFSAKHMMFTTVRGRFNDVSGELYIDPARPEASRLEVKIASASIHTGVEQRDAHLRSTDFLDAEKWPQIEFRSRRVEGEIRQGGSLALTGDLTIRGVTREVTLNVRYDGKGRDPWGFERMGFTALGSIDRRDFGLTWNQMLEAGGVLVSNEVKIEIEVQIKESAERQAA
jgi:polyisoprenoid-binding protein YceI